MKLLMPLLQFAIVVLVLARGIGEFAMLQLWRVRGWLHERQPG